MRDLSNTLAQVEREIRTTPVDDTERLQTLLRERGRLVKIIVTSLPRLPAADQAEGYERLLEHLVAGQDLADRLLRERALLVEAWGDSTREKQILRMFDATSEAAPARLVELG